MFANSKLKYNLQPKKKKKLYRTETHGQMSIKTKIQRDDRYKISF